MAGGVLGPLSLSIPSIPFMAKWLESVYCWAGAMSHYYNAEHLATLVPNDDWYPASIFFQGMMFMVFRDPTLRLPGPATPQEAPAAPK